jgi:hypothetical protein
MEFRRGSCSAGILPFRRRWQADRHVAAMAEPLAELAGIEPTHILDREIRVSVEPRGVAQPCSKRW